MAEAEAELEALVEVDGRAQVARLEGGVVQWAGGRVRLREEGVGVSAGAASLTLHALQRTPAACCAPARLARRDVRLDFGDRLSDHARWRNALEAFFHAAARPTRLLVLVNPKGGQGKAGHIFSSVVEPLFQAAKISIRMIETQHVRHALEIARGLDLGAQDGVVCVSGDGLVVEVLNGFLQREDWRAAVRMPIGIVPAGSGNGMVKSLLDNGGEDCDALSATFAIIQGKSKEVDVATVTQAKNCFHSVLNFYWGLTADADIESEKYRWMGGLRLTFQAVIRILNMRKYSGRLLYLPAEEAQSSEPLENSGGGGMYRGPPPAAEEERRQWREVAGEFVLVWMQGPAWAATDMKPFPLGQLSDGCFDVMVIRNVPRLQLLSLFLQMESGDHLNSKFVEYFKVRAARLEPGPRVKSRVEGGYVCVDGEVIARGRGSLGDASRDAMAYGRPFDLTIQQGLATFFAPL